MAFRPALQDKDVNSNSASPVRPTALAALVAAVAVSVWSAPDVGGTSTSTSSETSVSATDVADVDSSASAYRGAHLQFTYLDISPFPPIVLVDAAATDAPLVSSTATHTATSGETSAVLSSAPDFVSSATVSLWTHTPVLPYITAGTWCEDHRGGVLCVYGTWGQSSPVVVDLATSTVTYLQELPAWFKSEMVDWHEGDRTDADILRAIRHLAGGVAYDERPVALEFADLKRDVANVRVAVQQLHNALCRAAYC